MVPFGLMFAKFAHTSVTLKMKRILFLFLSTLLAGPDGAYDCFGGPGIDAQLADQVLKAFYEIRDGMRLRKRPSTSELMDWIAVLRRASVTEVKLDKALPFLGTLLKKEQDLAAFADQIAGGRRFRS